MIATFQQALFQMKQSPLKAASAAAALCLVAACATPPPPPPPASLSFDGTGACTQNIEAHTAQTVTIKKRQRSGTLSIIAGPETACQVVNDAKLPYVLYKLPGSVKISTIQAGGVFEAKRLFAAEVVTLDADLAPVRTFGPEAFLQRGGTWSVFFPSRANERYVLIRANPDLIGKAYLFTEQPDNSAAPQIGTAADAGPKTDYSYGGYVFARVFLEEAAAVGPKEQ